MGILDFFYHEITLATEATEVTERVLISSSPGVGAAVMRNYYEKSPQITQIYTDYKKNKKNQCNQCNLWTSFFHTSLGVAAGAARFVAKKRRLK